MIPNKSGFPSSVRKVVHSEGTRTLSCQPRIPVFHTKGGLEDHTDNVHGEGRHICEDCGQVYHSRGALYLNHRRLHLQTLKYGQCDKAFAHKNHLQSHLETHQGKAPYGKCGQFYLHASAHEQNCGKRKPPNLAAKSVANYVVL